MEKPWARVSLLRTGKELLTVHILSYSPCVPPMEVIVRLVSLNQISCSVVDHYGGLPGLRLFP